MMAVMTTEQGRDIAFERLEGSAPGVVFLGGFRSDMDGTKAIALREWALASGRAFLRFDYSGHGKSGGDFLAGAIGDWFEDARAVIAAQTRGPQVLVGSSMGGWISLLLAREVPQQVAGLVTIAAAPDFTEDSMWARFDPLQRQALLRDGRLDLPSEYSDDPYVITRRLIEEGRDRLVLRTPLSVPFPTRFLQGTADVDVTQEVALRLLAHVRGSDVRLTLVKDADHRFSTPECLEMIVSAVTEVLARAQ